MLNLQSIFGTKEDTQKAIRQSMSASEVRRDIEDTLKSWELSGGTSFEEDDA